MARTTRANTPTKLRARLLACAPVPYDPVACWLWPGRLREDGYAEVYFNYKAHFVHRASYELFVGPIPKDKPCILHSCDVRHCWNPGHLFPGTKADNNADMTKKGRRAFGTRLATCKPGGKRQRGAAKERAMREYVPCCKCGTELVKDPSKPRSGQSLCSTCWTATPSAVIVRDSYAHERGEATCRVHADPVILAGQRDLAVLQAYAAERGVSC